MNHLFNLLRTVFILIIMKIEKAKFMQMPI